MASRSSSRRSSKRDRSTVQVSDVEDKPSHGKSATKRQRVRHAQSAPTTSSTTTTTKASSKRGRAASKKRASAKKHVVTSFVAEQAAKLGMKEPPRVTPFQERVYKALQRVPKGKVTTYRDLAKVLGCGSCQAIGQALKRNPFHPVVPCHRVVAADLGIGGFSGFTDPNSAKIKDKVKQLRGEGIGITVKTRPSQGTVVKVQGHQFVHTFKAATGSK